MQRLEDKIYGSVLDSMPDLAGKCYAITGTTSGTGFWTAVAAVRKGAACVILLNRKSKRADEAEEKVKTEKGHTHIVSVDCDLQAFASVRSAADEVKAVVAKFGGLDGLINNAGIMGVPDQRTNDGFDVQMQTNHLSHFLLTRLLMPELELAAATRGEARIVQHSSGARGVHRATGSGNLEPAFFSRSEPGTLGGDGTPACFNRYHQTKLANPVFAMALHEKLASVGSKIKSLCAEPGVSATSLAANMGAQHAAAKRDAKPKNASSKPAATGKAAAPPRGMNFKPQSAADGASPLIMASFAASADSGDFYMPGDTVEDTPVGMPVKCMTRGQPTPTNERMRKMFKNEELTMNEHNRVLLWEQSEKASGAFSITKASKL